jgi:predicted N-acyltransferase
MNEQTHPGFRLKTYQHITEIDASLWDGISHQQPFGSYRWHFYAEKVMPECQPFYILVFQDTKLIGRAAFYLSPSEPLPLKPGFLRNIAQQIFRRWPLMIGRTPFANLSGVLLADASTQANVLKIISRAALEQARFCSASFVLFDFVEQELTISPGWESRFRRMMVNDPGTLMECSSPDFESYLSGLGKDERYHYRRIQRKAHELGIVVERHTSAKYLDESLSLIRNVETKHTSTPIPWTRAMLENLDLADGTWLTAHIGNRLVGCGLTLRDNGAQINTALGLVDDVPYVYFALVYESLRLAFENGIRLVRLGSGAYDVKKRLGFQLETNNYVMAASPNSALQLFIDRMA